MSPFSVSKITQRLNCMTIDKIDADVLVTELKLLKNLSPSFVPDDTFETVRDVSKALSLALREIYRSTARLYLTVPIRVAGFAETEVKYPIPTFPK